MTPAINNVQKFSNTNWVTHASTKKSNNKLISSFSDDFNKFLLLITPCFYFKNKKFGKVKNKKKKNSVSKYMRVFLTRNKMVAHKIKFVLKYYNSTTKHNKLNFFDLQYNNVFSGNFQKSYLLLSRLKFNKKLLKFKKWIWWHTMIKGTRNQKFNVKNTLKSNVSYEKKLDLYPEEAIKMALCLTYPLLT